MIVRLIRVFVHCSRNDPDLAATAAHDDRRSGAVDVEATTAFSNQIYMSHDQIQSRVHDPGVSRSLQDERGPLSQDSGYPNSLERSR